MLQLCGAGLAVPSLSMVARCANIPLQTYSPQSGTPFEGTDEQLLEEIQRASFEFFWNEVSHNTGQVKDRARAKGKDSRAMSSIAATGFGLASLCIGDKREYRKSAQILERVKRTLRFLIDGTPNVNGFYYHFIHMETGKRWEKTELSSIDTSLLLCGVLTARQYFADQEIRDLATKIYERVGGTSSPFTVTVSAICPISNWTFILFACSAITPTLFMVLVLNPCFSTVIVNLLGGSPLKL